MLAFIPCNQHPRACIHTLQTHPFMHGRILSESLCVCVHACLYVQSFRAETILAKLPSWPRARSFSENNATRRLAVSRIFWDHSWERSSDPPLSSYRFTQGEWTRTDLLTPFSRARTCTHARTHARMPMALQTHKTEQALRIADVYATKDSRLLELSVKTFVTVLQNNTTKENREILASLIDT